MANYNFFERKLAKVLSSSPKLKNSIKRVYQQVNFFLHKPSSNFKSDLNIEKVGEDSSESFFGYYDNNPVNNGMVLFQDTSFDTSVAPSKVILDKGEVKIIVKDIKSNNYIFSRTTKAFNWQQGCKLQWIDRCSFIYNDFSSSETPCAVVVNLNNSESKILKDPVYDAYKSEFYISLDFLPLTNLRPDYAYFKVGGWSDVNFENQSIKISNFDGESVTLFTISDINELYPLEFECDFSHQKFNHVMISPDGNKFVFLHRAYTNSGERIDRLFLALLNPCKTKCDISLISDSGMISHYCWKDDLTLISYMRHDDKDGYFIIDLGDDCVIIKKIDILGLDEFGDGHPYYIGDGKFITDSYPNKSRMKSLIVVDLNSLSFDILGEFLEPLKFHSQTRCDLHPKWDSVERCIYIDSVHEGKRGLYKVGPLND
ncbi:hypothetical protein [Vibrio splendidus]|uniref:hypothetical protein n=1 Tax=Vibrio splendidus TaxID=29497 RepID=UPI000D3A4DB3|nr:hypothetical protein [Vibrio splendidus]PTP98253.1 hypothetical protein CWO34_12320 [Vibrio splendidus]